MGKSYLPEGYKPCLGLYETQEAIGIIKKLLEKKLCVALRLKRVSAPIFVDPKTGLNDDLNGIERPVTFNVPDAGMDAQVVHSLAKWKRMALYRYDFRPGKGIITDMNAIRRDEELDNLHSVYVDQWDWEKIILQEDRNIEYLKDTARKIINVICNTLDELKYKFEELDTELCREVTFITTQELEDMYPELTPKERENTFVKEHKTVFLMKIGDKLNSGKRHDGRAPDYDDWQLNGDILFWNNILGQAFEISSMGIRVDAQALDRQLKVSDCEDRRNLLYHKMLLSNQLPLTIGGGIGQSRICMLLLNKAHIGEVQSSVWDDETMEIYKKAGIELL